MKRSLAVAAAIAAFAAPLAASAADRDSAKAPCFFVTQWQGWKSPAPDTIYLGVNNHDVYKVTLSTPSNQLSWPNMHLVSINRGSSSICSAIDLDLRISDTNGFATPLIARSLVKLTPEEVAAIPPKYNPN